jgi:hypothetical protein
MNATNSSFTINAETVALPSGFLQVRDFYIVEGGTKYALTIYYSCTNGSNQR